MAKPRFFSGVKSWLSRAFSGGIGLVAAALIGVVGGMGVYTLGYSGFTNYLGDNPTTCAQCHAMTEQYEGWLRGSHKNVATCNDCHAPHDNIISKYANKAENGLMHSLKFTLGNYPENIQIRPHNRQVTEAACLYCHKDFTDQIRNDANHRGENLSCIKCHDGVGHMR